MDKKSLEKYSSAFTLSDMEIFIFPELLYALFLANIMSPEIWKWRKDPWFAGIHKMGPLKKIHRVKQYIMDQYNFNLDLETWGLTDKETEMKRFEDFIDPSVLSRSNALFGYEGDKYYFTIDIRKHFGLDKYDSDIIPYWKTETVEAMNAFRFKEGYDTGAGECVSLACLYAAALFIVAEIPAEKIFLLGTPLHSQNFIMVDDGILTNNRRIVTKSMWFNGTELSALARRALENEQVTIVAHHTGYIHSVYPEATIHPEVFHHFREKITRFLVTEIDFEIFINFLRDYTHHQKYFQLSYPCRGALKYIQLEKAFSYEHGSKNRLGDNTRERLLCEIDEEELYHQPLDGRPILSPGDELFIRKPLHDFIKAIQEKFPVLVHRPGLFEDLKKFIVTTPKLPSSNKQYSSVHQLNISPAATREEIIAYLASIRHLSPVADLAFYSGRHMDVCEWQPFLKAVFERNPVSVDYFLEKEPDEICLELSGWPDQSIYEGNRLALPDEVVNYQRGDGIEKALTFRNVLQSRHISSIIEQHGNEVFVKTEHHKYRFWSDKNLKIPHGVLDR
jgi:hypothetical protein